MQRMIDRSSTRLWPALLCAWFAFASCASTSNRQPDARLRTWGQMRDVMRDGNTRARIHLSSVVRDETWGIGALAGLEGEITVLNGDVFIATVKDGELVTRSLSRRDNATLLALANVERWDAEQVVETRTLKDLEFVVEAAVARSDFRSGDKPIPIRIEGALDNLAIHVIDGNCPIANPKGRAPWRWRGPVADAALVGVYGEGLAGKLTHHGQRMHLHAVFKTPEGKRVSGHVDELALGEGARLFLPALRR